MYQTVQFFVTSGGQFKVLQKGKITNIFKTIRDRVISVFFFTHKVVGN